METWIEYDWALFNSMNFHVISWHFRDLPKIPCPSCWLQRTQKGPPQLFTHLEGVAWRYFFANTKNDRWRNKMFVKKPFFFGLPIFGQSPEEAQFCIWQDMVKPTDLSLSASAAYGSSACLLSSPWFQGFRMVLQRILNHPQILLFICSQQHTHTNSQTLRFFELLGIGNMWQAEPSNLTAMFVKLMADERWHNDLSSGDTKSYSNGEWWRIQAGERSFNLSRFPIPQFPALRSAWWSQRQ